MYFLKSRSKPQKNAFLRLHSPLDNWGRDTISFLYVLNKMDIDLSPTKTMFCCYTNALSVKCWQIMQIPQNNNTISRKKISETMMSINENTT